MVPDRLPLSTPCKKNLSRLENIGLNIQNPNDVRILIEILEELEKENDFKIK